MKKVDTLLFDLDGTLIDTNEIIIRSYQHAFRAILGKELSKEEIIPQIGPPLRSIFSRYTKDIEVVDTLIMTYRDYYIEHEQHFHAPYPYVLETLKTLKDSGYKLGIVTSKSKAAAWPSIKHYSFDKLFDVIITLDDVKNPKPSAEPIKKALNHLNRSKALMVGDNQSDLQSAQNAQIISVGVHWSIHGPSHLKKVNPDYMLVTMRDLLSILKIINH